MIKRPESYGDAVKIVEDHGGEIGPQPRNPLVDHIWHLRSEGTTLCGFNGSGLDSSLNRAGRFCLNCARALETWIDDVNQKDDDQKTR